MVYQNNIVNYEKYPFLKRAERAGVILVRKINVENPEQNQEKGIQICMVRNVKTYGWSYLLTRPTVNSYRSYLDYTKFKSMYDEELDFWSNITEATFLEESKTFMEKYDFPEDYMRFLKESPELTDYIVEIRTMAEQCIHERSRSGKVVKLWTLPKGAREEGESLKECAVRELREETGITIDSKELSDNPAITVNLSNQKIHFWIYYCEDFLDPRWETKIISTDEILEAKWVDFNHRLLTRVSFKMKSILGTISHAITLK